ncbi:hypothetical protein ACU4GD_20565 [Cupriavidus basilensis]
MLSPNRVPLLPDVPTLSEAEMLNAGLMAAVSRTNWSGLFAPAGTPAAIVERIGKLTIEFVNSPDAQEALHGARKPGESGHRRGAGCFECRPTRKSGRR